MLRRNPPALYPTDGRGRVALIAHLDIWRAARLLVKCYPDDTAIVAAQRAEEPGSRRWVVKPCGSESLMRSCRGTASGIAEAKR